MTPRRERLVVPIVLVLVLPATFVAVGQWASEQSMTAPEWLTTPVDAWIPVVPAAVWIYMSWYPATGTLFFADDRNFRRGYLAYVVAFVLCVIGFVLFPVSMTRPPIRIEEGLSAAALRVLYAADPPVNIFPSFHAAVAAILYRLRPRRSLVTVGVAMWTLAVCIACVLTRQHYVLDVCAGFVVGLSSLWGVDAAGAYVRRPRNDVATRSIGERIWRKELGI